MTGVLVDAFDDDPVWGSWAFPAPGSRRRDRTILFSAIVTGATRFSCVWIDPDATATAVWIPPGREELTPAQERQLGSAIRGSMGDRADVVLDACAAFAAARPTAPHFYLTLLGSHPSVAGSGIGGRLLSQSLEHVSAQGAPAYLEAVDALVPFYERFGFRVRHRFDLRDGPAINGMWREGLTRRSREERA